MKVTILGSGTCVPRLERSAAAALVEINSQTLLIDVGPGTMRRLLEAGRTIFDLTHVVLTHFHPDHTAELVPMLFATKYPDADRRKQPLMVVGGPGLIPFYNALQVAYGDWIRLPGSQLEFAEFKPVDGDALKIGDCRIVAYATNHRPESRAYRLETGDGRVVAYSGDSDWSEGLIAAARSADLFICESAYPDQMKVQGHLTPTLAGRIAQQAGARRLVLTHLYPPCDQVDIVKQAEKVYQNGPVMMAEDLMTFELKAKEG
jgi:ribonuclease BN (tRNA processing enzyme)